MHPRSESCSGSKEWHESYSTLRCNFSEQKPSSPGMSEPSFPLKLQNMAMVPLFPFKGVPPKRDQQLQGKRHTQCFLGFRAAALCRPALAHVFATSRLCGFARRDGYPLLPWLCSPLSLPRGGGDSRLSLLRGGGGDSRGFARRFAHGGGGDSRGFARRDGSPLSLHGWRRQPWLCPT